MLVRFPISVEIVAKTPTRTYEGPGLYDKATGQISLMVGGRQVIIVAPPGTVIELEANEYTVAAPLAQSAPGAEPPPARPIKARR